MQSDEVKMLKEISRELKDLTKTIKELTKMITGPTISMKPTFNDDYDVNEQ